MYFELLKKYRQQYGFKLFSFALMPNQLNLLMELKEGTTISVVMHNLNSSYTKYFNGRYQRKGHVFRERFKSVVVEKGPYLLDLIHYIHTNPARYGFVAEGAEYTFSSYLSYLYNAKSPDETYETVRQILSLDQEVREIVEFIQRLLPEKKGYADFAAGVSQDELAQLSQKLRRTGLLGSKEFVESVLAQMKAKQSQEAERGRFRKPAIILSLAIIVAGVVVAGIYIQKNIESKEKELVREISEKEQEMYEQLRREYASKTTLAKLDGTEWAIEVKPMAAPKGKASASAIALDKLQFTGGKVASRGLVSEGFSETNYTLTVGRDGTLVWETMQQNVSGDVVFWRGEEKEGMMTGTVSRRSAGGNPQDFAFTSIGYSKTKE
jgi:REP element-mobilizing transposase RayT